MSLKTQRIYLKRLAELVTQDLSYIHGERESGPNGAKKEYLQTGKTFLRAMAKDLCFAEKKVYDMPGGIGVAGEVVMMGMWSEGNGIYVHIHENNFTGCIMYRTIRHMKDYRGDYNRHLPHGYLLRRYEDLLRKFLELKQEDAYAQMININPSIRFDDYGGFEIVEGTVSHTFPLHIHNAVCFGMITDGTAEFYCGNKKLLKKGDTFFVPRGVLHTLAAISKTP